MNDSSARTYTSSRLDRRPKLLSAVEFVSKEPKTRATWRKQNDITRPSKSGRSVKRRCHALRYGNIHAMTR
jgi:hypothetical protein